MPNGQRRNRNSRHANTQRNLQNASVIEASAIAEIAEVVVAAEAFVDNSAEIERLKSRVDIQRTTISRLKKEDLRVRQSNDSMMDALLELRDEHGLIYIKKNRDGTMDCVPRCIYKFKDVSKLLDQQDDLMVTQVMLINRQEEEIKKLKTFCKSLMIKNEDGIKNMIKEVASSRDMDNLSKEINKKDDDLVCDINYSDEESDEESPPPLHPTPVLRNGQGVRTGSGGGIAGKKKGKWAETIQARIDAQRMPYKYLK